MSLGVLDRQDVVALGDVISTTKLHLQEVLSLNSWKRTVVLKGRDAEGRLAVLKWCSQRSPDRVKAWFASERAAYDSGAFAGYLAPLVAHGERWLLIEHVPGVSALAALDAALRFDPGQVGELTRRWLGAVLELHWGVLSRSRADGTSKDFRTELAVVHRSLGRSGPRRNPRTLRARAIGWLAWVSTIPLVSLAGRRWSMLAAARGVSHGDLHLDNLWLTDDGRVLLLDPANWSADGWPGLDVVYPLAISLARTASSRRAAAAVLEGAAGLLEGLGEMGAEITDAAKALGVIAAANPRFNPAPGAFSGVLRAMMAGPRFARVLLSR
jgi:hypothetical protein